MDYRNGLLSNDQILVLLSLKYSRHVGKSGSKSLYFSHAKGDTFCEAIYDTSTFDFSSTNGLVNMLNNDAHGGETKFDCHDQSGDGLVESDDESNFINMCQTSAQYIDPHGDELSFELENYSTNIHMYEGADFSCK